MKKTIVLLLAAIFSAGTISAQISNTASWKSSRHSIYFGGGINWLIGDFDRTDGGTDGPSFKLLKEKSYSLNLGYKYKMSERFSLRFSALYSKLSGDDTKSKDLGHKTRGVVIKNNAFDIDANIDFYFIKEKEVTTKPTFGQRWSSYIFVGAGALFHNPKWDGGKRTFGSTTVKNGDKLRDIHTENGDKYHKVTLAIPTGLGIKFLLSKKVYLGAEYALRFTTTDHLDDLHWNYRIENDKQRALAPAGAMDGMQRGGREYNDWYSTLLFNFGIKFGGAKPSPIIRSYSRPKYLHLR
jgi:hypothetical protein